MKIRIYILVVLLSMNAVCGYAKGYYTSRERPDQLMFHVTPTVSLLDYKSVDSKSSISGNIGIGAEYAHFFSQHWGLSVGAEISSFSSFYFFKGRRDSLELFDNWSSKYYMLRQNLTTKEHQNVTYLSFPVKFMYRHIFTKRLNFNASIGAAYGLYISENKSIISGTIDRQAFFGDIYVNIDEFYPLMFGKFTDYINPSPVKQFKSTVLGIAQVGFSFKLAEDWNMHTELNFQYGFQNIKCRSINILVPEEYSGVTATNYIGNIRPVSLGLRIGLAYTFDIFNVDCKCHNPLL
jgi:hypothetical protein